MALKQKIYENDAGKKKDFWLGVGLWFLLNIIMFVCSWGVQIGLAGVLYSPEMTSNPDMEGVYSIISVILSFLPLLINIGLIVYFAFTRSQMALGMLAGFGIALLIVICLGVVFMVGCLVILSSYSG